MTEATVVRAERMPDGTPEVPVAIVGAGACGLTAALALRRAGIDCVLVERDAAPRGSTALSSGFIPAAGTAVQRAAGIDDSAARFAADIQAKAQGQAAPQLVPAYTAAIGPALDALQGHGLDWELLDGFLYPGHTARRMHTLVARTGSALVDALAAAADHAGAVTLTHARVRQLWCDRSGRVIGVGFERPDGNREHLACRVLLLACNGFGADPGMVAAYLPAMRDAIYAGHPGNDGSAVTWARASSIRSQNWMTSISVLVSGSKSCFSISRVQLRGTPWRTMSVSSSFVSNWSNANGGNLWSSRSLMLRRLLVYSRTAM
jgi:fumarate reductase flavoprotein subunit